MRKADEVETQTWNGHEVTVETWIDETEFPWDGDGDAPDCEGVDLLVEVTLCPDDTHTFKAYGSLGGVYGDRAYVREEVANIVQEALSALQTELQAVAAGRDVLTANARQALAMRLLEGVV